MHKHTAISHRRCTVPSHLYFFCSSIRMLLCRQCEYACSLRHAGLRHDPVRLCSILFVLLFTIFASKFAVALCYLPEPLLFHLFISHYRTHIPIHRHFSLIAVCVSLVTGAIQRWLICHERRECLPPLACCWRSVLEFSTNVDILLFFSLSFVVYLKFTYFYFCSCFNAIISLKHLSWPCLCFIFIIVLILPLAYSCLLVCLLFDFMFRFNFWSTERSLSLLYSFNIDSK